MIRLQEKNRTKQALTEKRTSYYNETRMSGEEENR